MKTWRSLFLGTVVTSGFVAAGACAGGSKVDGSGGSGATTTTTSTTTSATGGAGGGAAGNANGGGGHASGGGGSGATGGHGGNASGGAGGSGPVTPECTDAAQCQLVNDCCLCEGLPIGEVPPTCPIPNCFVNTCTGQGLPGFAADCVVGRCVAGFDCDPATIVCADPKPSCSAGEVVSVRNGCWGPCVPATECTTVGDCTDCDPSLQACVTIETHLGKFHHCVVRPAACDPVADCACLGSSVCIGSFDTCADANVNELSCTCPVCD